MSVAADDDTTKVDNQEKLCRDAAARLGWDVHDVYQDNNRSAWKKNRKRPEWDRMLADVEAGKITAIMVYHGDRLIRQPEDLTTLLKLADGKGIQLASPTGTRDLGNGDDRFVLYIEAAMAMRESDNTSRRRKAQYARWRTEGKTRPGGRGGRAFGFTTKDAVNWAEAELIRQAAQRILGGESAGQVTRWLNDSGAVTVTGRPFTHTTVRRMLARPRYAGLMPDGVSKAAWEPVLERADWEMVSAILDARAAGFSFATNARVYLLSGIARCGAGACGHPLAIRMSKGRQGQKAIGYGCVAPACRKVFRSQPLLDTYVTRRVVNRLRHEANPAGRIPEAAGLAGEFATLMQARGEIEEALADHTRGKLPALLARLDSMDKRLAQLRELAGDDARSRLLAAHAGITEEEFAALPLSVRRSLVRATFDIVVLPASRRGPGFDPSDVRMTPR